MKILLAVSANPFPDWFTSENTLHGFTILGVALSAVGFLFLSYDLLGKPQGVLRWLVAALPPVVVGLLVVYPFYLLIITISDITINILPWYIISPQNSLQDIAVYSIMIGVLQGILIASSHIDGRARRFLWKNAFIGLFFALLFFIIDEFIIYQSPLSILDIPDALQFIILGFVGGGIWHRYGHSLTSHNTIQKKYDISHLPDDAWLSFEVYQFKEEKEKSQPPFIFSRHDFIRGFGFWLYIGLLSLFIWFASTLMLYVVFQRIIVEYSRSIGDEMFASLYLFIIVFVTIQVS